MRRTHAGRRSRRSLASRRSLGGVARVGVACEAIDGALLWRARPQAQACGAIQVLKKVYIALLFFDAQALYTVSIIIPYPFRAYSSILPFNTLERVGVVRLETCWGGTSSRRTALQSFAPSSHSN